MNEKLKELARLAKIPTYYPEGISERLEKFAELIVKECASIVYKTCQDGDAGAQAILYEFDIDNARSQK